MNPKLELYEKLFSDAKANVAPLENFFDELWFSGASLPAEERRDIVERVNEYVRTEEPPQAKNKALAQFAMGFISFHEGKYDKSLMELARAQKLFADIPDEDGAKAVAVLEGCDYRTLGELELAINSLLEGYDHLSKTGAFKMFFIFSTYNLAEIYSETGQYEEALRFHELCVKLNESAGNKHMLARTLNGIGVVYLHQKKYALALDYLLRALALTEEVNNLPVKARVLTDIGAYYFETGNYAKAAEYEEQALAIRREQKIPNGEVTNLMQLAKIAVKQNNNDKAIELLNEAEKIAEEIKVKPKIYQIHEMLSDIYQLKGDLDASLFHYRVFHQIREEVLHEDNEKKIKNLRLIFEAEQTKKENAIIKSQKKEIEAKNLELQETIDELTITKVSRKAKVITLFVGIALIVAEDLIMTYVKGYLGEKNLLLSLSAKVVIILLLKPIDRGIEEFLLRRLVLKKRKHAAQIQRVNGN